MLNLYAYHLYMYRLSSNLKITMRMLCGGRVGATHQCASIHAFILCVMVVWKRLEHGRQWGEEDLVPRLLVSGQHKLA